MNARLRKLEQGSAMVMAIVFSLILVLISVIAVNLLGLHSKGARQDELQEIQMLRKTVKDYMDCRQTFGLRDPKERPRCSGQALVLRDSSGRPLYPRNKANPKLHQISIHSIHGGMQPIWDLRASCEKNAVRIEKRMVGTKGLFSSWGPLWPESEDPELCRSYFEDPKSCGNKYDLYAWFDPRGPTCCRMIETDGTGAAAAVCTSEEYLITGGAYCAPKSDFSPGELNSAARTVERCKLDAASLAFKHVGTGSARGITLTGPSLNAVHTDSLLPAIMYAQATYPKTKAMLDDGKHSGFLLQSGPSSLRSSATIDSWVAACKMDDWEGTFRVTARAFCCPKRP